MKYPRMSRHWHGIFFYGKMCPEFQIIRFPVGFWIPYQVGEER